MNVSLDTRLSQLWQDYPETEARWNEWAPGFKQLANPAMRSAVAQATSIEMAAKLCGLNPGDLLNRIREATGAKRSPDAPAWFDEANVVERIDADAMLATGVHPVGRVRQAAASLAPGRLLELRSSFRPDPLIELMKREGCEVYCVEASPGRHATYFTRT
jgi:hypothetical protein